MLKKIALAILRFPVKLIATGITLLAMIVYSIWTLSLWRNVLATYLFLKLIWTKYTAMQDMKQDVQHIIKLFTEPNDHL